MSLHAMPFLVANYGCEMLFVLNVRLEAQLIEPTKAVRIKNDIVNAMFGATFMDELFRPQPIYTNGALRKVFTTVSDSSIMKLNENSMRKLYDLMSMSVKYQVLSLHHPYELLDYTANHLSDLKKMCGPGAQRSIDAVLQRVQLLAACLTVGELASVRAAMLNFVLDRRVKVSLFLDSRIQRGDGNFALLPAAYLAPVAGVEAPGFIVVHPAGKAPVVSPFRHRDSALTLPAAIPIGTWTPQRFSEGPRMSDVGTNMYRNSGDALAAQAREMPGAAPPHPPQQPAHAPPLPVAASGASAEQLQAYHNEMSYLSQIVSHNPQPQEKFRLSLFEDEDDYSGGPVPSPPSAHGSRPPAPPAYSSGFPSPAEDDDTSPMIKICRMDAGTARQENRQLLGIISGLDSGAGTQSRPGAAGNPVPHAPDSDNLLDIMDDI